MGRTASAEGGYLGVMTLTAGGQLEAIAWYTSQGFSTALGTFVAQNYAAGCEERIRKAFKMTLGITAAIGIGCTALFYVGGEWIFSLITPEQDAYRAGGLFLKIDSYSMIFMMLEITTQGVFYGTGRTVPPALVSITGNMLRIPLALLLGHWGMGDSRRMVGHQYVQYPERLCLVRLVGFAAPCALDRQYVETPF